MPRSRLLHNLLHEKSLLRTFAGKIVPKTIRSAVRRRNLQKPSLDPALRRELTESFRPDILKLQDILQRDLSPWMN